MPTDFNRVNGHETTTARELANELGRFAEDLKQTADELRTELASMKQAKEDISDEISSTAQDFVANTLDELEGDEFDTIAEIGQNVPELGSQGLAFYRKKLTDNRDSTLQAVNETLDVAVDAAGFQAALQNAEETYTAASGKASAAYTELGSAQSAFDDWKKSTTKDDLVELDDEIAEKGGHRLTADNKDYYKPSLWKYITSSTFRTVRHALDEYGHGTDGKDAFADLENFRGEYKGYEDAITNAQADYEAAEAEKEGAENVIRKLRGAADDIKTDEQILEAVQAKVAQDLVDCPEFIIAMAKHYEEDFPRNLPLLIAKQDTLGKLIEGTQGKLSDVQNKYTEISRQFERMSRLRPNQKVKGDLDQISRRNKAKTAEYRRYRNAARDSWTRTRDYEWDYDRNRTVYINEGPDLLTTLLIYDILSDRNSHYDHVPGAGEFQPDENANFAADLIGVDQEAGEELGLPGETFELSEEASEEMAGFGFEDYQPGETFDAEEGETFEIEEDDADMGGWGGEDVSVPDASDDSDVGSSFEVEEDAADQGGWGGSSDDDDDFGSSPSFGGPTIGS